LLAIPVKSIAIKIAIIRGENIAMDLDWKCRM